MSTPCRLLAASTARAGRVSSRYSRQQVCRSNFVLAAVQCQPVTGLRREGIPWYGTSPAQGATPVAPTKKRKGTRPSERGTAGAQVGWTLRNFDLSSASPSPSPFQLPPPSPARSLVSCHTIHGAAPLAMRRHDISPAYRLPQPGQSLHRHLHRHRHQCHHLHRNKRTHVSLPEPTVPSYPECSPRTCRKIFSDAMLNQPLARARRPTHHGFTCHRDSP